MVITRETACGRSPGNWPGLNERIISKRDGQDKRGDEMKAEEIRKSQDNFKKFQNDLKNHGAYAKFENVQEFYGRKYIVLSTIKLTTDVQRIEVIDITSEDVALFSGVWPDFYEANKAIVVYPDEGHVSYMDNDGDTRWASIGEIAIRISVNKSDMEWLANEMDNDLQNSIDAGGKLF